MLTGELDVQLIRMRDSEIVIDIGMEVEKITAAARVNNGRAQLHTSE